MSEMRKAVCRRSSTIALARSRSYSVLPISVAASIIFSTSAGVYGTTGSGFMFFGSLIRLRSSRFSTERFTADGWAYSPEDPLRGLDIPDKAGRGHDDIAVSVFLSRWLKGRHPAHVSALEPSDANNVDFSKASCSLRNDFAIRIAVDLRPT